MKDIIASLGFIAVNLIWVGVVARGIARLFRVPVRRGFFWLNRQHEHLTPTQYIWTNGVLVYGMTLFISRSYLELLDWKLGDVGAPAPTLTHLMSDLGASIVIGLAFGFWTAPPRRGHSPRPE